MEIVPNEIKTIANRFADNGYELYIVGGAPRDMLLNNPIKDYDLITDATPDQIKAILDSNYRLLTHAEKFGILVIISNELGSNYEIATYRKDGTYKDNRRPESVTYTNDLEEDLKRRDFLCNTICFNPLTDEFIDLLNGKDDLNNRIIRTVGDPDKRFNEDALRILRAYRFAVELDFILANDVIDSCNRNRGLLNNISGERKQVELSKMVVNIDEKIDSAYLTNTLDLLNIPVKFENVDKLLTLKSLDKDNLELIFAILFNNIHLDCIKKYLNDLRFPRKFVNNVYDIVKLSTRPINQDYDIKYLIYESGNIMLARDILMLIKIIYGQDHLDSFKKIINSNEPIFKSQMNINGNDLLELDIEPKEIGDTLDFLLKFIHINPQFNSKQDLIGILWENKVIE